MMVLLSVRKNYCDLILKGVKQFEFRKRLPNQLQKGDQIALYCTRPISRVVAYVNVVFGPLQTNFGRKLVLLLA